jgi:predicted dehydrogenase
LEPTLKINTMKNLSRRKFLQSAAVAGTGAMFIPNFISCAPSNSLKYAVIGVGGRGQASWDKVAPEDIVALCDVDDVSAADGYKALPHAKRYKDFRKMFDEMESEFDAVIIATPDHTHFPATMAAMQLGKHVLVEKPLAHNIWQLRTLKKAAKYYGVVSQMANQGHTTNGIRQIKEWYDAGVLGEVKEVHAWLGPLDFKRDYFFDKPANFPPLAQQVPANLDWDLWVGGAKKNDYNKIYAPVKWRGFYDYGNGKLGDWACHMLDAPFWALGLGMPLSVDVETVNPVADHSFVSDESEVTYKFAARGDKAPVTLKWSEGISMPEIRPEWGIDRLPGGGMIMFGSKKTLITGSRPNNPHLMVSKEEWKDFQENAPAQTIKRVGEEKPVQEWIDAIKGDYLPGSNFDYSADLTEMALVGVLAQRSNTSFKYDSKNMKAVGHSELDKFIKEPVREGWSYGEDLW